MVSVHDASDLKVYETGLADHVFQGIWSLPHRHETAFVPVTGADALTIL